MKRFSPGDIIVNSTHCAVLRREIVDVRDTGYGWKYPEFGDTTPDGGENYRWSENSVDPMFQMGWKLEKISAERFAKVEALLRKEIDRLADVPDAVYYRIERMIDILDGDPLDDDVEDEEAA